jgi:sialate O-acetylesterase
MKLNCLFNDNMVLQARKPIRIFGTGEGVAEISFCGHRCTARAEDGKWLAELPPMEYGGPYTMEVALNGKMRTLHNIMVGEVILCAGQSNIQFELHEDASADSARQDNPLLRLYTMDRPEAGASLSARDGWCVCTKDSTDHWSALCYHLGMIAAKNLKAAVGVVSCCQGASVIQSWIHERITSRPEFYLPDRQKHPDHFLPQFAAWNREGLLYHAMTEQFFPMSVRNVVWYQGESNTTVPEGNIYLPLLKEMISCWRSIALDPELPFTLIQICDFDVRPDEGWSVIQEAQLKAEQKIPNVRTVISRDVCESFEIHPRTKNILAYKTYCKIFNK